MKPNILQYAYIALFLALSIWFWQQRSKKKRAGEDDFLLDDVLKYMFDCEYREAGCGLDNLSGHLQLSPHRITKALSRLLKQELIRLECDTQYTLTEKGRKRALSIIRKHRLIERYLADETGMKPEDWHPRADRFEHFITDGELENITRRTGHPVFDPHGDPIPSSMGEIPEKMKEFTLLDMTEKEQALITHMEDEPVAIYKQLLEKKLYPQLVITFINKSHGNYHIDSHLGEIELTPMEAAAINIRKLDANRKYPGKSVTLQTIPTGEPRKIIGISEDLRGQQRRRLLDLGFVPGNVVIPRLDAPGKDTRAYEILNTLIALRSSQSNKILVSSYNPQEEE